MSKINEGTGRDAPGYTTADARRDAERQQPNESKAMQTTLTMKIERTEAGEFIAYFLGRLSHRLRRYGPAMRATLCCGAWKTNERGPEQGRATARAAADAARERAASPAAMDGGMDREQCEGRPAVQGSDTVGSGDGESLQAAPTEGVTVFLC